MNYSKAWQSAQIVKVALDAPPATMTSAVIDPETELPALAPGEDALLSGSMAMALLDLKRLGHADAYEKLATRVNLDAEPGTAGLVEREQAARLKAIAGSQRKAVSDAKRDREDLRRGRGRFRPYATHSPARPFQSAVVESPADYCRCPACGARAALTRRGSRCKCSPEGRFQVAWETPEQSERFAMAAARAAGAALAEETGSSVEYQAVHDAAGVYSHTEAVPDVGYEPVLRAEESLRPSGMPSQLQHAAECMAVRREQTVAMVELAQVTRRATLASRTSVRSMGKKAKRGKRGGRRG